MTIFICGLPRTGKTTFSKKLKTLLKNSNIIVSEALRNALQKIDSNNANNWGLKNSDIRRTLFPSFAKEFIYWNEKFSCCDTIFDCALLNIEQVLSIADKNDMIICFGFGGRTNNEIFKIIKKYEHANDYTKQFTCEKLMKFWGDVSLQDKENIDICKRHNIIYLDTSIDRDKKFNDAIEQIKKILKD